MKTKRFNLFDLLIVLLLAALVAGFVFKAEVSELIFSDEDAYFVTTVRIENIENNKAELFKNGDSVYYSADGNIFGTITLITKEASTYPIISADGTVKEVVSSTHCNVILKINTRGYVSNETCHTKNGIEIFINSVFRLENDLFIFDGKLTEIEKVTAFIE